MSRRRVFITGIGPISAIGLGIEPMWSALLEGRSAIDRIRGFDPGGLPYTLAAEMPDGLFKVRDVVPKSYRKSIKVMCRDVELAVGAAVAAVRDAGIVTGGTDPDVEPTIDPDRFGCHIGAGLISAEVNELTSALVTSAAGDGSVDLVHWGREGMENLTPLWLLKYLPNMLACHVTIVHVCRGPSNTITCCEASSALSLGESSRTIERGGADACLTGGCEHKVNLMSLQRQVLAGRLATGDDGGATPRPFAPDARGTVLGEGGGLLVVEAEEMARARGARLDVEVAGFAATQSHCPDTIGLGGQVGDEALVDVIELALADASVAAGDVDAIVPFGSSIPSVDAAERHALETVFGDRTPSIPLVTTVPYTGNCAAGNGAIQLCVAAQCIREQRLPARIGPEAVAGLDAGAEPSRDASLGTVVVLTSSQGGQNAAVVLRRGE